MITINYDYSVQENIDYHNMSLLVDRIIFLENIWLKKNLPPTPVGNISLINTYIRDIINKVSPNYISLGLPLLGYDWNISSNIRTSANLMSLNSTLTLAYDNRAVIQFDEVSQTPYFEYSRTTFGVIDKHVVWFIDARSINALGEIIIEYDLIGTGIWNVTSYYQQLFSILTANYNIIKLAII